MPGRDPSRLSPHHPQAKIIEAKFRFSVLLQSGREQDLEQLQLVIHSPERRLRVVDFQPRTELASELAGDVEVSTNTDTVASLNASLGGVVSGDHGPAHVQVSPTGGLGVTQNRGSKETFHRLSPKQAVLASGTINAEHGVFFKWRRTTQVTLEGSREVTCRFLVPHDWQGDWVELTCDLSGRTRNYLGERIEPSGHVGALVGLYLAGDANAQAAAAQLAAAQMPPPAGATASGSHVAYKPVLPAERRASPDWFGLPALFKPCDHKRNVPQQHAAVATDAQANLPAALEALGNMSGQQ